METVHRGLYTYLGIVIPLSIIIPLFFAIVKYKVLPVSLKFITYFLIISAISNAVTRILAYNYINNMPVMHLYTLAEFVVLAFYYKTLFHGRKMKDIINSLIIVFIVIWGLNIAFMQDIHTYNTYTKSAEALLIIILSIIWFKDSLDNSVSGEDRNRFVFSINSGLLLYFCGSFVWFTLYNFIVNNQTFVTIMGVLHATLLLILYILIAIALWKYRRPELTSGTN